MTKMKIDYYFPAKPEDFANRDEPKKATAQQFHKVLLRMMPSWASEMGEGKLLAAVIAQAWADANVSIEARKQSDRFFNNETKKLEQYSTACGLNWEQISEMYEKHCNKRGLS